jgi:hypothetical protein
MDKTLLQQQRSAPPLPTDNGQPGAAVEPRLVEQQQQEYRELIPSVALVPVRMKLEPPVEFDGQTYTEIVCDFEKLIGADFIRCEREFRRTYKPDKDEIPFAQMNPLYHVILISEAADVPRGLIKKLPGRYFTALQNEALKVCGSSAEEKKT